MSLYQIRFRDSFQVRTAFVEASDPTRARAVAEAWCAQTQGRLVSCEPAVVADESILAPPPRPEAARPLAPIAAGGRR